jgi:hypothetical protein
MRSPSIKFIMCWVALRAEVVDYVITNNFINTWSSFISFTRLLSHEMKLFSVLCFVSAVNPCFHYLIRIFYFMIRIKLKDNTKSQEVFKDSKNASQMTKNTGIKFKFRILMWLEKYLRPAVTSSLEISRKKKLKKWPEKEVSTCAMRNCWFLSFNFN